MKVLGSVLVLAWMLAGCGGGAEDHVVKPEPAPAPAPELAYDLEFPEVTYKWDPQAGDPAVPSELGGPGFTGEGWESNFEFPRIGDPKAVKGGELVTYTPDWPATLRMAGKDWNTSFNYAVNGLAYEGLLASHPTTLEFIPSLATHWQISEDKQTYRFRINPEARWSNGKEVTSADVVESWRLRVNPDLMFPSSVMTYGDLNEPKAVSKYIVEVTVKTESWRNFLAFSTMSIFPAEEIAIPGSEYLDKYQFAYTSNSGPYTVKIEDIDTGKSITITRRKDYWGENNPANAGLNNLDRIKYVVVKDPNLAFEMIKKGELDYMIVSKAQWWAENLPEAEGVKRGLLVPRKFYNDLPIGLSGFALNMTRAPLDDIRVRKALQHLYDRETMIEKLFFDEYEPLTSYFQGGVYANPNNVYLAYDELGAVQLLEEAGWKEIDKEGYRVKDGQQLALKLSYSSPLSERSLTVFQEACKKAGIKVELELLTPATAWKNLTEKQYQMHDAAWGAIVYPNPESQFSSELADQTGNNNVTAFRNPKVDELAAQYNAEYDPQKRAGIVREIDGLVYQEHPYVLGWYNPAVRVAFWNKFGFPHYGIPRFSDWDEVMSVIWVDPKLEAELTAAKASPDAKMDPGEQKNVFWDKWNEAQAAKAAAPAPAAAPAEAAEEAKDPAAEGEAAAGGGH